MSSQHLQRVLSITKKLGVWSNRFIRFFKHRMLTKKKNILIFGEDTSPLYQKLYPKLSKTWQITQISYQKPLQQQTQAQIPIPQQTKPQKNKQITTTKTNQLLTKLYLHNSNYAEIQKQLEGKQFDSIVLLPVDDEKVPTFSIHSEQIIQDYTVIHQETLMKNLFAYRLANKYLTSSGVFILSASESDFVKENGNQSNDVSKKYSFSSQLIDAQISYLGVIIGDRDYTDLNSWSIVALSKQCSEADPQFVANYYRTWADSQQLPMPGSFALFKRKNSLAKNNCVQYL